MMDPDLQGHTTGHTLGPPLPLVFFGSSAFLTFLLIFHPKFLLTINYTD